jgi:mannose-6-phosphate isomerase-like protein (cupin superfamily)
MKSWTKQLSIPSIESDFNDSGTYFKLFPIKTCTPRTLHKLETHVSILSPENSPHEPHVHNDEELIIIISGKVQIIRVETSGKIKTSKPLSSGSFIYHDSARTHTIYSVGPEPAVYICARWNGKKIKKKNDFLKSSNFIPNYIEEQNSLDSEFKTSLVFESQTEFLDKLHCHFSNMKPGAGYEPHKDSHDVLIILLDGKVETLGEELEPISVIFYQAGEFHGMKNIGSKIARYLVFEFHRKGYLFNRFQIHKLPRLAKSVLKKVINTIT